VPAAPEYVLTQTVTCHGVETDTVGPTAAHILNEV
jgi:cytochrome c551/c552